MPFSGITILFPGLSRFDRDTAMTPLYLLLGRLGVALLFVLSSLGQRRGAARVAAP